MKFVCTECRTVWALGKNLHIVKFDFKYSFCLDPLQIGQLLANPKLEVPLGDIWIFLAKFWKMRFFKEYSICSFFFPLKHLTVHFSSSLVFNATSLKVKYSRYYIWVNTFYCGSLFLLVCPNVWITKATLVLVCHRKWFIFFFEKHKCELGSGSVLLLCPFSSATLRA